MAAPRRADSILLVLAVLPACISEERAHDGTADSGADTVTDPCSEEGRRECLDYRTGRVCHEGAWRTEACPTDQVCAPGSGQCEVGSYTCMGLLVCYVDCPQDEQGCPSVCSAGATVAAVDQLDALNDCQCQDECWPILCGKLFPWPTYGEISTCVAASCPTQGAACIGGGRSGTLRCKPVRDCMLGCRGDVFCAEECLAEGSPTAQVNAAFYYACLRKECGADPGSECLFRAQNQKCADLWATCQGVTTP